MGRVIRTILSVNAAILMSATPASGRSAWRDAFQSSPAAYEPQSEETIEALSQQMKVPSATIRRALTPQPIEGTVRYRIAVQVAGSQVRVRLSNEEGKTPLQFSAASVAIAGDGFSARAGSILPLRFSGAAGATIPVGAPLVSDPIDLPVKADTPLLVSIAVSGKLMSDLRGGAGFVVAPGDQTRGKDVDQARKVTGRPLVSGILVKSEKAPRVIVTFGDSITDGNRAAPTALHGWPEELGRRLRNAKGSAYTVVNAGIGGNRLLGDSSGISGLARLDRDALRIDGVSHLILLEGINDIGMSGKSMFGSHPELNAQDLIAAYRQIIVRAHARGIKLILGTLTPMYGSMGHYSPAKEALRQAVNHWMRTSGEADGVIDFEAMVRDPAKPDRLLPAFDSGDHLHPGEAGYKAMGEGVDLRMFP